MKHTVIQFEPDNIDTITDELVQINQNFYTKRTNNISGCLKFPIPTQIKADLSLNPGDLCYFVKHNSGDFIKFKNKPENISKRNITHRTINYAGMYNTLYVTIPQQIKKLYESGIISVQLMQIQGMPKDEWLIKFLSTECI